MRLLAISWKVVVLGSYLGALRIRSLLAELHKWRNSRSLVERKRVLLVPSDTFNSVSKVQQTTTMSEDFLGTFEVVMLKKHLEDCLKTKEGQIHLQSYCRVFKQLYKFFCLLGTVFGFVGSDVKSKVEILEAYLQDDRGNKYETVEKMVNHEIEEDIVNTNKESSGSRTFLRLHRSLIFVSQFLENSLRIDGGDSTAGIAKTAYDNTLAKYHPWLVKKGAHLAMYTLPTKKDLYIKVSGSNIEKGEIDAIVTEVIALTQKIYDQCDQLYHDKDLHSLPFIDNRQQIIIMDHESGPKFHTINESEWLVHKSRFEFLTSSLVDRQFEIAVRQNVQKVYEQMEKSNAKLRKNMALKQLALPSEIKEMKFSDVLKEYGTEGAFDLLKKLMDPSTNISSSAERERTPELSGPQRPLRRTPLITPSHFVTPAHRGLPWQVFEKNLPTTVKKQPPRQAKPGEPVYAFSSTGSPVIPGTSAQFTIPSKPALPPTFSTRIKQDMGSGAVIDVDLVWHGVSNELKNKFQADFRTWAQGWTTVKGKKLVTNTISKKKQPRTEQKSERNAEIFMA